VVSTADPHDLNLGFVDRSHTLSSLQLYLGPVRVNHSIQVQLPDLMTQFQTPESFSGANSSNIYKYVTLVIQSCHEQTYVIARSSAVESSLHSYHHQRQSCVRKDAAVTLRS
jgi:hypothetical protein